MNTTVYGKVKSGANNFDFFKDFLLNNLVHLTEQATKLTIFKWPWKKVFLVNYGKGFLRD